MLIAITGGIGCGKSVVSKLLRVMGYNVYDCDEHAKQLMLTDEDLRKEISVLFGKDSYFPDGTLNKKHLSDCIFGNKELLKKMNDAIHPAVAKDLLKCLAVNSNTLAIKEKNILFFESAILYESHFDEKVHPDAVISVSSPIETRIQRAMSRDNVSRQQVLERINSQMLQDEKNRRADFVIHNDDLHSVIAQVEKILGQIL